MDTKNIHEIREESFMEVKGIIKGMKIGISDQKFMFEYVHNPNFHRGVTVLTDLVMKVRLEEEQNNLRNSR